MLADASRVRGGRASAEPGVRRLKAELDLGPRAFVVRATGDSLAPDVRDGDHVQVDPDVPVEPGRAVALRHRDAGGAEVLRLVEEDGCLLLRGTRPGIPDRALDADAEADILGVAVFGGRAL